MSREKVQTNLTYCTKRKCASSRPIPSDRYGHYIEVGTYYQSIITPLNVNYTFSVPIMNLSKGKP